MTLVSSGPISLAGTATSGGLNQSIQKELGGSGSSIISLNDTAVRSLLGAASGPIGLSSGYGKALFTPHNDDFTSAGSASIAVPAGAAQLVLEVWGGGGGGGNGATGTVDHQGGGGGAGGYAKSTYALASGDWGKTINYTVGAAGAASSTSGSALNAGSVGLTANQGSVGIAATGTTNGTGGAGGTASGGNTSNVTGGTGTGGNSGGTAGQGAAANNGGGAGGQGGYTSGNTGRTAGQGGRVKFSWT